MPSIHPTAIIEEGARVAYDVVIGPYCVIGPNVTLEKGVTLKGHVWIEGHTTLHEGVTIYPGAVIGTKTQDKKFQGEKTFVDIGKNTEIRECCTINSSCQEGTTVKVGENCLLMAYCHVAHNCEVGNDVIMSNNATLAGHVIVEDHVVIGGLSGVHQFCRIGRHAMVGGMSRISHDIPPFTIGGGMPYRLGGLNLIGLKRRGIPLQTRKLLAAAFRLLYRSGLGVKDALQAIEATVEPIEEVVQFLQFCRASKRGLIGLTQEEIVVEQKEEETAKQALAPA